MSRFKSVDFKPGEEKRLKQNVFDLNMDPREWMARYGHNIISGDMRVYKYEDKKFEAWIFDAFEALTQEGLENLWNEFLNKNEIEEIKSSMDY